MTKSIFQEHELDAFLGKPDDFDVEAIIEEATEVDYKTGNRVWAVETDELNAIAERHRKPQDDAPKWDNGSIVAVLIEGGSKGYDELVAYDINAHKFVDDDGNLVDDDYRPEYDAHQFVLVDYNEVDFDVENEAEWLEYAGGECGLVFEPGLTRDNGSNSSVDYYRIAGRR